MVPTMKELFLMELEDEAPVTRRALEQVPEGKNDWKPHEKSMALGDLVYPAGRVNQYTAFFWNTYNNVPEPSLKTGAPLMATVPFYALLGNHDIAARPGTVPDGLAAYYFFHGPKNGPGDGPWATPLGLKDAAASKTFRANTLGNYPALDAYSFDYGPAHFTIINDNARMAIRVASSLVGELWVKSATARRMRVMQASGEACGESSNTLSSLSTPKRSRCCVILKK